MTIKLPMACSCKPKDREALDQLVAGRTAGEMLYEMYWESGYMIKDIGVDMWCGMTVTPAWDSSLPDIYIMFDRLEDGFAKVIEYAANNSESVP